MDFWQNAALSALKGMFNACGVGTCDKRSIGISCASCGVKVCQNHHYFAPPDVADPIPKPICVLCVVKKHQSLAKEFV